MSGVTKQQQTVSESVKSTLPYQNPDRGPLGTVGTGMIWGPGTASVGCSENACHRRLDEPIWRICG